ncbi:MAG: DUF3883 domain-containing protein [Candidatus Pacearchaeota archaeon]|nr:DUF3883 domain-containing protein [Candidatus Pacearchaeota archaeon]
MFSNTEIEEGAIKHVLKKEPSLKRADKGLGYDLCSKNKFIEVKGTASNHKKQHIIFSGKKEYDAWKKYKRKYFLYRVINVGKPNIEIIQYKGYQIEPKREFRWRVKINK